MKREVLGLAHVGRGVLQEDVARDCGDRPRSDHQGAGQVASVPCKPAGKLRV